MNVPRTKRPESISFHGVFSTKEKAEISFSNAVMKLSEEGDYENEADRKEAYTEIFNDTFILDLELDDDNFFDMPF